jgi:hypothetical protein
MVAIFSFFVCLPLAFPRFVVPAPPAPSPPKALAVRVLARFAPVLGLSESRDLAARRSFPDATLFAGTVSFSASSSCLA